MQITKSSLAIGLLFGLFSWGAMAQTPPPPEVNHNVVGWMSNRPYSALFPDSYVCSPGSTIPVAGGGALPLAQRYDGAMLTPSPMSFSDASKHIAVPEGQNPTLVQFQNLDPAPAEIYVDYPFTTASFPNRDVVMNQAFYSMNSGTNYGSQFHVRMALVDGANVYPLGASNPVGTISALQPEGVYFFVSNQAWPLAGAPNGIMPSLACGPVAKIVDQGIAGTVQAPVPLIPGHAYMLRAYIGLDSGATDRRAMIDDVMLFMQTVEVTAQNDGLLPAGGPDSAYTFPALTGGTTPNVLGNDQINAENAPLVPAANRVLSQVSADPGLTLNPGTGEITVAPGQSGTKTLTYQLCPDYAQSVIPGFTSNACKTAVATVTLTGPGVVVPAVPTLQQGVMALMGLALAALAALGLRRRKAG